jgi:hypothetical protein
MLERVLPASCIGVRAPNDFRRQGYSLWLRAAADRAGILMPREKKREPLGPVKSLRVE